MAMQFIYIIVFVREFWKQIVLFSTQAFLTNFNTHRLYNIVLVFNISCISPQSEPPQTPKPQSPPTLCQTTHCRLFICVVAKKYVFSFLISAFFHFACINNMRVCALTHFYALQFFIYFLSNICLLVCPVVYFLRLFANHWQFNLFKCKAK